MRPLLLSLISLFIALRLPAQATSPDVATPDAILAALYQVISGDAGVQRDWDRFRNLLHPEARLAPIFTDKQGEDHVRFFTVEQFVEAATANTAEMGFFEREIGRRTERFGSLINVFSAYESFHSLQDPKPFDRGVNSITLMHDGTRWWILSITWQGESPTRPIPKRYLRHK
jgi:hypothetical protein